MRIFFFISVLFILFSCENETDKGFETVTIEEIYSDSISIRAIAPVNENSVWFAGNNGTVGFIEGTTPKLATIRYADSLLHFRAIAANDTQVFVLSVGNPGVLYKIDFNGQEATHIEDVYIERGEKVFYDAMKFWNNKEGIAMGDPTEDCLSILITRNGGKSWDKLPCSQLPPVAQGEAAFAASNSNIAMYKEHTWIATGGKRARVFYSPDKGKSWEVYTTPILQGKQMTGIYSIDFFDKDTGIIFGGDWDKKEFNEGNKAITHDGGKTWKLLSNGEGPGYRSSVKFVPGTQGKGIVAVGIPGISYSADQGKSWKELSAEGFYAIEFVNDSVAFASGQNKISKLTFQN